MDSRWQRPPPQICCHKASPRPALIRAWVKMRRCEKKQHRLLLSLLAGPPTFQELSTLVAVDDSESTLSFWHLHIAPTCPDF